VRVLDHTAKELGTLHDWEGMFDAPRQVVPVFAEAQDVLAEREHAAELAAADTPAQVRAYNFRIPTPPKRLGSSWWDRSGSPY
jgi:hypothetical protein